MKARKPKSKTLTERVAELERYTAELALPLRAASGKG
jgi:hypothetical protein